MCRLIERALTDRIQIHTYIYMLMHIRIHRDINIAYTHSATNKYQLTYVLT